MTDSPMYKALREYQAKYSLDHSIQTPTQKLEPKEEKNGDGIKSER